MRFFDPLKEKKREIRIGVLFYIVVTVESRLYKNPEYRGLQVLFERKLLKKSTKRALGALKHAVKGWTIKRWSYSHISI